MMCFNILSAWSNWLACIFTFQAYPHYVSNADTKLIEEQLHGGGHLGV